MPRTTTVGYTPAGRTTRRHRLAFGAGATVVLALLAGALLLGRLTAPASTRHPSVTGKLAIRDGIPVPARHSAAGAATAAANYQIAGFHVAAGTVEASTASAALLAPKASATARRVLAAPTTAPDSRSGSRTSYAPLSLVVQSYRSGRAVVQVWGVAASSSRVTSRPAGTEDWGRATVTLLWDGSRWRVSDEAFTPGPWPSRDTARMAHSDGDFSFRFDELRQGGWTYVPER